MPVVRVKGNVNLTVVLISHLCCQESVAKLVYFSSPSSRSGFGQNRRLPRKFRLSVLRNLQRVPQGLRGPGRGLQSNEYQLESGVAAQRVPEPTQPVVLTEPGFVHVPVTFLTRVACDARHAGRTFSALRFWLKPLLEKVNRAAEP